MMNKCHLCGREDHLIPGIIEFTDGETGSICSTCVQEELKAIYDKAMEENKDGAD